MRRGRPWRALAALAAGAAAFGWSRPRAVVAAASLLSAGAVLSGSGMRFRSEPADLAPAPAREALGRLEELFGGSESLVVVLRLAEDGEEECLLEVARAFKARLAGAPQVASVRYRWLEREARDPLDAEILAHAPLCAPEEDLEELDRLLTPRGIEAAIARQAALLGLPGLDEAARWIEEDPLDLRRFLLARLGRGAGALRFRAGTDAFLSQDGRALLVRVEGLGPSSDIALARELMAKVGAALAGAREEVAPRFPAASRLDAEFSGGYALAVECEAVVRRDLTRNLTLSVVLVVAFLLLAWRRVGLVTAAGWSLALGLLIGFGLFSAIRREIVSLALVGGALLAAAGIDYAIHVIRPLCVARGRISRRAVVASCAASARPLALAALTTVAAFLALCVSGEALLRDLGLLTACGIAAAFLSALVLLPACLALCVRRRRGAKPRRGRALRRRPRAGLSGALAALAARRPGLTVAIASLSALASAACVISSPPRVLPDLRGIHSARSGALEAERRLKETFAAADEPALVIIEAEGTGEAPEDAALDALLRFERELAALAASEGSGEGAGEDRGLVLGWSSALRIVPAPAEERAVLEVLARKDPDALDAALEGALAAHGFAPEAFAAPRGALRALLSRRVPLGVEGFRRVEGLAGFDRLLARRGGSGFALVAIHPRGSLWESEEKSRLVSAIHGALERAVVRGEVTGLHLAAAASSRHVVTEFLEATGIALIAVAVIVILLLRGALSLAALVPVGLSCLWTGAAWSLLGLDLHFMNVSVLPMVLGIGVDDGIHLVARYSRRPSADVPSLYAETGSAVVLTTVTTLAAFGTLAFSENRGLASVGFLAVFGISSALLASLLVLPALLELDRRRRARGAGRGGGPGSRCGS